MFNVSVSNLVVTRSNYPALAHADFTLSPTFCALVVGPNGSGKTTLLKALAGMEEPTRGTINVENVQENFAKTTDIRVLRQRISYVGHSPLYMRHVTVKEHIELCKHFDPNGDQIKDSHIDEILEKFKLNDRKNVKVENLSAGQQRRLHIASAYLRTNSILCIDEPHASLDDESKKLIDEIILELKSSKRSTFIATHEPERLKHLATHIIDVKSGKAVLTEVAIRGKN